MRLQKKPQIPYLFLTIITMCAIAVFVQLDRMQRKNGNNTGDLRAKAFQQTATGIRIEGEEMTLSGTVVRSADGQSIAF